MIKNLCLVLLTSISFFSDTVNAENEKRYFVNAADVGGATTLPAYLTTGTNVWDKATLTTFDWDTWDNPQYSTLSTSFTTPTSDVSIITSSGSSFTTTFTSSSTTSTSTSTSSTSISTSTSSSSKNNDSEEEKSSDYRSRRAKIVIGVVVGIVGLLIVITAILLLFCYMQKQKSNVDSEKDVSIREISGGIPTGLNSKAFGLAAIGGAGAAGAVEILDDDDNEKIRKIDSPMDDNASTITGSFASLSEKLKEIQQQYSHDGEDDRLSTFSTLDGDDEDNHGLTNAGAAGAVGAVVANISIKSKKSSTGSSSCSNRSSISSYRSSLKEVTPSVNNYSTMSISPKQTPVPPPAPRKGGDIIGAAAVAAEVAGASSSSSSSSLYKDRKKIASSEDSSSESIKSSSPKYGENLTVGPDESPASNTTTGNTVVTGVNSDAASFEQDQNFPNKYNNFATELLSAKTGKPTLVQVGSKPEDEGPRKKSVTTVKSPESIISKKRDSQFDFESEDDKDGSFRERKPSEASYFSETV